MIGGDAARVAPDRLALLGDSIKRCVQLTVENFCKAVAILIEAATCNHVVEPNSIRRNKGIDCRAIAVPRRKHVEVSTPKKIPGKGVVRNREGILTGDVVADLESAGKGRSIAKSGAARVERTGLEVAGVFVEIA